MGERTEAIRLLRAYLAGDRTGVRDVLAPCRVNPYRFSVLLHHTLSFLAFAADRVGHGTFQALLDDAERLAWEADITAETGLTPERQP
jgi:hypothetical protein